MTGSSGTIKAWTFAFYQDNLQGHSYPDVLTVSVKTFVGTISQFNISVCLIISFSLTGADFEIPYLNSILYAELHLRVFLEETVT
jgi:hypothetical protein